MPKLVLAIGADAAKVEAVEGFANYNGPTPPAGLYFVRCKQIAVTQTKDSKKTMLRAVLEFKARDKNDPRKKYDGYALFHHLVVPDDEGEQYYGLQVGQINRMLDALSGDDKATRVAFWSGRADTDAAGKKVIKVGKVDLTPKEGIEVLLSAKAEVFNRKVLENGKPKRDPKTKKEIFEPHNSLRVNDLFPADDERGKDRPALVEDAAEEENLNDVFVDEDEADAVVADADGGLDDPADDGDADAAEWPEEEPVAAVEDYSDIEETAAEVSTNGRAAEVPADDDDSAELIAQEVPEEPVAPQRRRRSAF